jgi:hypothetical protein
MRYVKRTKFTTTRTRTKSSSRTPTISNCRATWFWRGPALIRSPSLGTFPWTDATIVAGVTPVKAVHLTESRTALHAAYTAAARTPPTYTHPTITGGATVITAVDIAELRAAILAVW